MTIKEYFNITDPAYTEREIYEHFKHTTRWKVLVLKVRLYEFIYALPYPLKLWVAGIYYILYWQNMIYPVRLIDLVNRWEN